MLYPQNNLSNFGGGLNYSGNRMRRRRLPSATPGMDMMSPQRMASGSPYDRPLKGGFLDGGDPAGGVSIPTAPPPQEAPNPFRMPQTGGPARPTPRNPLEGALMDGFEVGGEDRISPVSPPLEGLPGQTGGGVPTTPDDGKGGVDMPTTDDPFAPGSGDDGGFQPGEGGEFIPTEPGDGGGYENGVPPGQGSPEGGQGGSGIPGGGPGEAPPIVDDDGNVYDPDTGTYNPPSQEDGMPDEAPMPDYLRYFQEMALAATPGLDMFLATSQGGGFDPDIAYRRAEAARRSGLQSALRAYSGFELERERLGEQFALERQRLNLQQQLQRERLDFQRRQNRSARWLGLVDSLLTVGGTIGGALIAGPPGAAAGATAGSQVV